MNFFKNLFGLLILVTILFSACQKENFDVKDIKEEEEKIKIEYFNDLTQRMGGENDEIWLACFLLETPFEMLDAEGESHVIENMDDFIALRESEVSVADFVYPLTIMFKDSEESEEVNNAAELALAFAECLPEDGWDDKYFPAYAINFESSCFQLVYPVKVMDKEENENELEDEEALSALLAAEEDLFFVFPLHLLDEEGEEIEVEDAETLFDLILECKKEEEDEDDWDYDYNGLECYEIEFPITVILADGEELEIEDAEKFAYLLLKDKIKDFVYPFTLIGEENETFEVENEEQLDRTLDACEEEGDDQDYSISNLLRGLYRASNDNGGCYEIQFPFRVVWSNWIIDVSSLEQILNLPPVDELLYPLEIKLLEDERIVEINNDEELEWLFGLCEFENDFDHNTWQVDILYEGATNEDANCFSINFPITILRHKQIDNNSSVFNSEFIQSIGSLAAYVREMDDEWRHSIAYPVEVTLANGEIVSLEHAEMLRTLFLECGLGENYEEEQEDSGAEILWAFYEGGEECYRIEFPIEIRRFDERDEELDPVILEDMQQFERLLEYGIDEDLYYKLIYPLNVIWENGDTIEIEDIDFLKGLLERC